MEESTGKNGGKKSHILNRHASKSSWLRADVPAESPELLEQIIDFLPDATFAIDREGSVIAWNRAMERLTGVSADDMLGKGDMQYSLVFYDCKRPVLIDLVNNPDPDILSKYESVRREGDLLISETAPYTHLYGGNSYLNIACPLYDGKGNLIGAIECIRDITEQRKSEEVLRQSEFRYRSLFETASDAIFLMEEDVFIDCNSKASEMLGCSKDEILGKTPLVFSPEVQPEGSISSEKAASKIQAALDGRAQFFEWRHRRPDGSFLDTEVSLSSFSAEGCPFCPKASGPG